jgi:hypothetical protein
MSQQRKFGLTVGAAFLGLGGVLLWRDHVTAATVAGGLGTVLLLAGVVAPSLLTPVERAWMAMAHAISKVTTPLFMGIVYYLVVVPTGFALQVFGRNPLRRTMDGNSYWVDRRQSSDARGDLSRQF